MSWWRFWNIQRVVIGILWPEIHFNVRFWNDTFFICLEVVTYPFWIKILDSNASMKQMKTLIDISQSCTQEIQFECYLSSLYTKKKCLGAWINRDGKKEFYFVGSNHNHHVCSCGLDIFGLYNFVRPGLFRFLLFFKLKKFNFFLFYDG